MISKLDLNSDTWIPFLLYVQCSWVGTYEKTEEQQTHSKQKPHNRFSFLDCILARMLDSRYCRICSQNDPWSPQREEYIEPDIFLVHFWADQGK